MQRERSLHMMVQACFLFVFVMDAAVSRTDPFHLDQQYGKAIECLHR